MKTAEENRMLIDNRAREIRRDYISKHVSWDRPGVVEELQTQVDYLERMIAYLVAKLSVEHGVTDEELHLAGGWLDW